MITCLLSQLEDVDLDFEKLSIEYLFDEEKIRHAFSKFTGIRLDMSWDEFHNSYFNFLMPLYFSLKGEVSYCMIWSSERRLWFRDRS